MPNEKFLIAAISVVIAVMVATFAGCNMYKADAVRDAVNKGADPIKAHCAIYGVKYETAALCASVALQPRTCQTEDTHDGYRF